jgi:hypothetical protein
MAAFHDLEIEQGATFSLEINVVDANNSPVDLSVGYTANSVLRRYYQANVAATFTVTCNSNIVTLSMNANTTNNLELVQYVYDVKLTSNTNVVTRLLEGYVTIKPKVT